MTEIKIDYKLEDDFIIVKLIDDTELKFPYTGEIHLSFEQLNKISFCNREIKKKLGFIV